MMRRYDLVAVRYTCADRRCWAYLRGSTDFRCVDVCWQVMLRYPMFLLDISHVMIFDVRERAFARFPSRIVANLTLITD